MSVLDYLSFVDGMSSSSEETVSIRVYIVFFVVAAIFLVLGVRAAWIFLRFRKLKNLPKFTLHRIYPIFVVISCLIRAVYLILVPATESGRKYFFRKKFYHVDGREFFAIVWAGEYMFFVSISLLIVLWHGVISSSEEGTRNHYRRFVPGYIITVIIVTLTEIASIIVPIVVPEQYFHKAIFAKDVVDIFWYVLGLIVIAVYSGKAYRFVSNNCLRKKIKKRRQSDILLAGLSAMLLPFFHAVSTLISIFEEDTKPLITLLLGGIRCVFELIPAAVILNFFKRISKKILTYKIPSGAISFSINANDYDISSKVPVETERLIDDPEEEGKEEDEEDDAVEAGGAQE